MKIKDGYNNKEIEIRINSNPNGTIELWIIENGKSDRETVSYLTANELLELYQEIKSAGNNLFN